MDGIIAKLQAICDLADRYDALVMVDDSHAIGFIGETRPRHARALRRAGRVDIITGTLGKALGGATGGYHRGAQGDRRLAAPALAALSVLQQHSAESSRRVTLRVLDLLEHIAGAARTSCSRTRDTSAPE